MPKSIPASNLPSAASPVFSLDLQPSARTGERVFFQWRSGVLRAVRSRCAPAASGSLTLAAAPFESAAWAVIQQAQQTAAHWREELPREAFISAPKAADPAAEAAARRWSQKVNAVCGGDATPAALARAFGEGLLIWREILPVDASETDEEALLAPAREAPDGGVAWGLPQTPAAAARDIGDELTAEAVSWARLAAKAG